MKLILFFLVLLFLIVPVNAVDWHDDSRLKRVQLNVNNSSVALSDYQIIKTVAYDNDMQTDFDDLLFYNESGGNVSYWIESKTDSNTADVWLKISSISTTEGAQVWMYYDNSSVSSASSGDDTFELYHDGPITTTHQSTVTFGSGYAVRVKSYHPDLAGYLAGWGDQISMTSWLFYRSLSSTNNWAYEEYNGGSTTTDTGINADTNYHIWDIGKITGTAYYTRDGIYDGALTTSAVASANRVVNYNSDTVVDWYAVRKYTATEPTWGADGEEESYEAPPPPTGTFLYPNSTYSIGYYGRLTSELVYETGINFSDINTFNQLTPGEMEVMSIDDTNYIPSIDKDAAHDGYMYGNFSLPGVESVNFINVKTVHNRNETNPVILGLFNVSTQKWHAVNNSSVEIVDVELTYNITGTDIIKYTTLTDNILNLSVSLNTNGDGNYDVFVDYVEIYIDYEEVPYITLEYVHNLTISNKNDISILQNDVNDLENNMNNVYMFILLCTVFLVATLRKRGDQ